MICGKSYSFRIRFPKEYAFTKTFESVFDEDTFFNSCPVSHNLTALIIAGRVDDPGDGAAVRVLGLLLLLRAHARRGALPRRRRTRPRLLGLHVEVGV